MVLRAHPTCNLKHAKWLQNKHKLLRKTPIDSHQPALGSWIAISLRESFRLRCRVCAAMSSTNKFATDGITSLKLSTMLRHNSNAVHVSNCKAWVQQGGNVDPTRVPQDAAPPATFFHEILFMIRRGAATLGGDKHARGTWCLSEALKKQAQLKRKSCRTFSLMRDESKGRLLLRNCKVSLPNWKCTAAHLGWSGILEVVAKTSRRPLNAS